MTLRRTGIKRGTKPMRRTELARGEGPKRSRKPLARMSARRDAERDERANVRAAVIANADGNCQAWGIPDIPHDHPRARLAPDRRQVHELQGGSLRAVSYLDADGCLLLCGAANQFISNGSPAKAERRGLCLPSWCGPEHVAEAAVLRAGWQSGERPVPSWWPQGERY